MSLPVFALVRRQDHIRALAALEVAPENPVFPAIVNCPLCQQNTLHLFDDILTDGVWFYCADCGEHGNIITFGRKIWKTGIAETIKKFGDFGLIKSTDVARQMGDCLRTAEKADAADVFWETAANQLWEHDDDITACRLRELGVQHEIKSGSGLVGVAYYEQVAELCSGIGRRQWRPVRGRNPCIVFPYYDLPGRISGFLLSQYDNSFREKKTFLSTQYNVSTGDAGYFLLNTLLQPPAAIFRSKQFIVEDASWALDLQCTNLAHGMRLAPVVASYGGPEIRTSGRCWPAMFPATRLFQTTTASPQAISQACNARGYVCAASIKIVSKTTQNFLQKLRGIYRAATPWQPALEQALENLSDVAGYAFATKLNIPHDKLQEFFARRPEQFSREFQSQVLAGLKYRPSAKDKTYGRATIIARDGKWWTPSGVLVCNGLPIITRVTQTDTGTKTYDGYILLEEERIDFTAPANIVDRSGLLDFIAGYAATLGRLVTFDRQWNKKSLLIAMQLQPPSVHTVATQLGWDETANVFRLGDYSLTNAGEIEYTKTANTQIKFPEPGIAPPGDLAPLLLPSDQHSFFWAVAATLIANLLAPVLRKQWQATAIAGPAFDVAKNIGAAIGCSFIQTDTLHKNGIHSLLRKHTGQQNLPLFIASTFDDRLFSAAINRNYAANIFVRTTKNVAAIGTGYGWQEITGPAGPPLKINLDGLCALLPMYLQHNLRSRMRLSVAGDNLVATVVDDLSSWLGKIYGQTFNPRHVKSKITSPTQAHVALFNAVNAAIVAGKIDVLPRPRRADQPANYLLRRKNTWWINRKAIEAICYADKNIAPNWLQIIDLLVEAGLFIEDEVIHKLPGFVVAGAWCDQLLTTVNREAQKKLG